MNVQLPIWVLYTNAFAIAAGALIAAIVGVLNFRLNAQKRRDDLFDRRYKFYQKLTEVVLSPEFNGSVGGGEVISHHLRLNQWEARFLFGEDIAKHLIQVSRKYDAGDDFTREQFDRPFLKYMKL